MRTNKFKNFLIILLLTLSIFNNSNATPQKKPLPKIKVATSFSILADIVKNIGGDKVSVHSVIGFGCDVHDYVLKPSDLIRVQESKILFLNGYSLESGWISTLVKNYKGFVVNTTSNLKSPVYYNNQVDPHAWGSPMVVIDTYIPNIIQGLCYVDSINCNYYKQNGDLYTNHLRDIDQAIKKKLGVIPIAKRQAITTHDAFGYYAREYNTKFIPVYGVANEDISAKSMIKFGQLAKKNHVKVLFLESVQPDKLMQTIARENQIKIGGKLYSDSLYNSDSVTDKKQLLPDTYVHMLQINTYTMFDA